MLSFSLSFLLSEIKYTGVTKMRNQNKTDHKQFTQQDFVEQTEEALRKAVGSEADVSVQKVCKNNGIILTGVSIFGQERNVSPTVYLESYYGQYLQGESMEEILEEILSCFREHDPWLSFDTGFFVDYELAKEHIAYKLISREKNEKLLEEIPYIPYLDLAITFFCKIEHEELGCGAIQIRNEHMWMWGVTGEQLLEDAKRNMRTLYPELVCTMPELLKSVEKEQEVPQEMIEEVEKAKEIAMYVVTNAYKSYGAAVMLYEGIFDGLSERLKSSLAILPSSVHELIVLPVRSKEEAASLRDMVHEINTTRVEPEEVLTDSVYYYGQDARTVTLLGKH